MENDFSINYNGVTGPGQSKSNLTEGLNYLDILSVYGGGQVDGTQYDFNIGGKMTDDENLDIKQYSLTHFNFRYTTPYQAINFGDTFEFLSPFTLSTAVKGASYKYRGGPSPWLPQVTMLYGRAMPRWDALWGGSDTESTQREVYGARVMYALPFALKTGVNVVSAQDADPVPIQSDLYDIGVYSVDFDFRPIPELTISGESAFNDTRVARQNGPIDERYDGRAYRIKAIGEYASFRLAAEYERITPEFENPMGSAFSDREKVKFSGQYQFNKKIHLYTNLLWFRDNLNDQKPEGRTDVWRPEVAVAYNTVFNRPDAAAKLSYRKEIAERGSDRLKFDDLFNLNYRDAFGLIETDTNLGYNLRRHENGAAETEEFVYNTTLRSYLETAHVVFKPNLHLGGWRLRDELSIDDDRALQYAVGLGIDWPEKRLTSSMSVGINELKIEGGDDSTKSFGNFNISWEPLPLAQLKRILLYLKGGYNDLDFSTDSENFREEKLFAGIKIKY